MTIIGGGLLNREAVPFQQEFHGGRLSLLRIVLEQLEQVRIREILVEILLGTAAVIDRSQTHTLLVDLTTVDLLLDRADRQQPIHDNIALLANTEYTVNSLVVICWVPIRVQYDCTVCTCQVEPKTADFRRQESTKNRWVFVELNADLLAKDYFSIAVNTHILDRLAIFIKSKEAATNYLLYNVEYLFTHREDEDSMPLSPQIPHQL